MSNKEKGVKGVVFVVATFVGGIVGAVTGLLLAPQSGEKTREQIRKYYDKGVEKANEYVNRVEEKIPEIISRVTDEQKKVKGDILQFRKDIEEKFEKTVEKGKITLEGLKKKPASAKGKGKKKIKSAKNI